MLAQRILLIIVIVVFILSNTHVSLVCVDLWKFLVFFLVYLSFDRK